MKFPRIVPMALMLAVVVVITGCSANKAMTEPAKPTKDQIRILLKNNPDLVLDVLRENKVELLNIVVEASKEQRTKAWRIKMRHQLENPLKPVINSKRPLWGDKEAPFTIVAYSNFKCSACVKGMKIVEQVLGSHPKDVRLLIKHITQDEGTQLAATYYEAIGRQSSHLAKQFYHRVSRTIVAEGDIDFDNIMSLIEELNVDRAKLDEALADPDLVDQIKSDAKEFKDFKLQNTPSYIVAGAALVGAAPANLFEEVLSLAKVRSQIDQTSKDKAKTTD